VKVRFVPVQYTLGFNETGLPSGTPWSVHVKYRYFGTAEAHTARGATALISFEVPNGTFTYTVSVPKGYLTISTGEVSISGAGLSVRVAFVKEAVRSDDPAAPGGSLARDGEPVVARCDRPAVR